MNQSKLKVKVEISRKSSVFTNGNENKIIIGIPFSNILANVYIYIGTSLFSLMGNKTVHEDRFKYKYKLS